MQSEVSYSRKENLTEQDLSSVILVESLSPLIPLSITVPPWIYYYTSEE
jgi:hypothetical protein